MYVSVTFLGLQRAQARADKIRIPLSKDSRIADLLAHIKASYPELPFPENGLFVVVNNKISSMDRILKNNDNVTFLPFLGGG